MSYFNNSDSDEDSTHSSYDSNSDSDTDFIIGGAKENKNKKVQDLGIGLPTDDIDDEVEDDLDEIEDVENIPEEEDTEEANNKLNDTDDEDAGEGDEEDDEDSILKNAKKKIKTITSNFKIDNEEEDDEEDEDGGEYLKKFNQEVNRNYIMSFHQESVLHNYDEILNLAKVVRDKEGTVIDPLHKTLPYLTKYEKTRIIGQRAKQIDSGATSFVKVPENVIEGYLIAELELKEKNIPFIIRRPLPNGGSEYWHVRDLENIIF